MFDISPFSQAEAVGKAVCKDRTSEYLSSIYPFLRGFACDGYATFFVNNNLKLLINYCTFLKNIISYYLEP